MTTKPENIQQQNHDHSLDSDTLSAAGELSDAQLERVAAGTSSQCQTPPSSTGLKNSRS